MVLDSTSRFKSEAAATFYIGKTGKAFWVELLNVYVRCHLNGVDIVEGVDVGCVFHYLIMFSCSQQLDLCDESSRARENVPIFLKGSSGIIIIFGDDDDYGDGWLLFFPPSIRFYFFRYRRFSPAACNHRHFYYYYLNILKNWLLLQKEDEEGELRCVTAPCSVNVRDEMSQSSFLIGIFILDGLLELFWLTCLISTAEMPDFSLLCVCLFKFGARNFKIGLAHLCTMCAVGEWLRFLRPELTRRSPGFCVQIVRKLPSWLISLSFLSKGSMS